MFKKISISTILMISTISIAHAAGTPGPCDQIKQACTSAGFVVKEAKEGKGLWRDCVNPIIQGTTAKKSVIALPSVDPSVVAACKAKHPKFGEGKVGN